MKKALLTGIAVLVLASGPAKAEMLIPPQYRGLWCGVSNGDGYRRCREPDSEVYIEIHGERISVGFEEEMELCGIGIGWPTKNGHAFTVGCPKGKFSLQMELRLDARGRLHVKEADRQEFRPRLPEAPSR